MQYSPDTPLTLTSPRYRLKLYALLLALTALSVPFLHIYLDVELSAHELAMHTLGIVGAMALVVVGIELLIRIALVRCGGVLQISVRTYWVSIVVIFFFSSWAIGAIHTLSSTTRNIVHKHQQAGYEDMILRVIPLALLMGYLIYVWLRGRESAREIDELRQLNDELQRLSSQESCRTKSKCWLSAKQQGEELQLEADMIVRIQSDENYCHIWVKVRHTSDFQRYTVRLTLREAMVQLTAEQFVQAHRSHVVNLAYVTRLVQQQRCYALHMVDGAQVPVSRGRIKQTKACIQRFASE